MSNEQHLQDRLEDMTEARRIAADAADRFRDVICEVLDYTDENPGDDVLVVELREHFGKTGPEPTRWRDFLGASEEALRNLGVLL